MCPCESSTTLWVLPYLILDGNSPQSCMHSYWCSPSPRMAFLESVLLAAHTNGAAAPAARKVRRVLDISECSFPLPDGRGFEKRLPGRDRQGAVNICF